MWVQWLFFLSKDVINYCYHAMWEHVAVRGAITLWSEPKDMVTVFFFQFVSSPIVLFLAVKQKLFKTKSFLFWSTRKIPSGQDGPILKVAMRGEKTLKIASEQIKNIIWSTFFFIISYNWCIVTHTIFASCYVRVTLIKIAKFAKLQCRKNFRL